MKKMMTTAVLVLVAGMGTAVAQDTSLPAACLAPHGGHEMSAPAMQMEMPPMDEAHQAMMAGMGKMNADMDQGMQAEDIDVAFICGMIPHHQGAIDMAKAELQYGDDPFARELAQKVIEAQEAEIAQMKEWLAKVAP
jgi:uncharacterized protein (DUF305 family)